MEAEELYKRLDVDLRRKKRQIIIKGVFLLVRFLFETAVLIAVIWLVLKQCNS